MRCDTAQRVISDRIDGAVGADTSAEVDDHAATCAACRHFEAQLDTLRRELRVAALEAPPDIAGNVRARLEAHPRRRRPAVAGLPVLARAAAVFVVAFALGAAAVGLSGPGRVEAVELGHLVRAGQHRVESLQAEVVVTEHGWHPQVPERTYAGTLRYAAPEALALDLDDRTRYPDPAWRDNDVTVVVDQDTAWSRGRVGCPVSALPDCAPERPRTTVVTGREPFDTTEVVPLDLVVPVASFATAATSSDIRHRTVDGRAAVEVTVPVAQLRPMLEAVLDVGAWRALHATDEATVTLDAEYGIPLRVEVAASSGTERGRWAAALGHDDTPGAALWTWELHGVEVNDAPVEGPPPPPAEADVRVDRGFDSPGHDVAGPLGELPVDMTPHRTGRVDDLVVHSWSSGGAWLRVRVHTSWTQPRLFGRDDGRLVRRVQLPSGGLAYVAEGGEHVFVHGPDADVEVTGSLGPDQLREVADRLGIRGRAVPRDWTEASSATLQDARDVLPDLLLPPALQDFAGPGIRVSADTVTLSYAGNGERGFVLTQSSRDVLAPPLDAHVLGVTVRGVAGRYTPRTGELEWVERDRARSLRSTTLPLAELVAIAAQLEAAE